MIIRSLLRCMIVLAIILFIGSEVFAQPNIVSFDTYVGQLIKMEDGDERSLRLPTSIRFENSYEIITDLEAHTFYYRSAGSTDDWCECHPSITAELNRPHTLTYAGGYYYATDTNGNRIIMFDDLEDPTTPESYTFRYDYDNDGDKDVCRNPHDVIYNPNDGYIYMINAPRSYVGPVVLWRFREGFRDPQPLDLTQVAPGKMYPRSLTIVNGTVYVNSTHSRHVIEVKNFKKGKFILHSTVVDDYAIKPHNTAYYRGYWYSVNQRSGLTGMFGHTGGKITAWQDWNEHGNIDIWYDLSCRYEEEIESHEPYPEGKPYSYTYPYNMTVYNGYLYITAYDRWNSEEDGKYDRIFRLKALSPEELIALVESTDLPQGIKNSLIAKLEGAEEAIQRGQQNVAINKLNSFINEVEAQRGKKLTDQQADELVGYAEDIISSISANGSVPVCPASARIAPLGFQLAQNYPNSFNPDTWIPYQLAEDVDVTIKIYDTAGRLVRTLDLGHKPAGFYSTKEKAAYWNGRNEAGEQAASGIYFYTIQAGDFTATRKLVIAR